MAMQYIGFGAREASYAHAYADLRIYLYRAGQPREAQFGGQRPRVELVSDTIRRAAFARTEICYRRTGMHHAVDVVEVSDAHRFGASPAVHTVPHVVTHTVVTPPYISIFVARVGIGRGAHADRFAVAGSGQYSVSYTELMLLRIGRLDAQRPVMSV